MNKGDIVVRSSNYFPYDKIIFNYKIRGNDFKAISINNYLTYNAQIELTIYIIPKSKLAYLLLGIDLTQLEKHGITV